MYSLKLYTQQEINYFSLVPIRNNIDVNRHFEVNLVTKSKFQLVGSLLRPADLRKYKDEIEHRDDIQYPFYDALPGYQETETASIKRMWLTKKLTELTSLPMGSLDVLCGTWTLSRDSKVLNATLLSMVILLKTMMVVNMKHVKISVFVSLSLSQVKTTTT